MDKERKGAAICLDMFCGWLLCYLAFCCSHFATETLIARSNFDFPGDDDYHINNDDYHTN